MRRRSVRARITVAATAIVAVVLVVLAVLVVVVQRAQLVANLDNGLEQRAELVNAQFVAGGDVAVASDDDRFVQVLDGVGGIIVASDRLGDTGPLAELPIGDVAVTTRADVPLDDDSYRVLIRAFDGRRRFVVVGEDVDDVDDALRDLVVALAFSIPAALVALAGVMWWLVGRTLRPVDAIRREVDEIGLDELDHRVPVPGGDDELTRLAVTMNDMLARLEVSSARQRQFVADVSHELRTPLTRLRTQLEVDLAAGPTADLAATCRSALGDTVEMQHLVDDLLFLARHDAGLAGGASELLDLDVIVEVEVRHQRELAPGVVIDTTRISPATVVGVRSQLARVIRNLLGNATRHARDRVEVAVNESDDAVTLTVDDDGQGIPAVDRERVFERFVRLDPARHGGGAGLGLAIVGDIVAAHGGAVAVDDSPLGGARLVVRLPVTS